MDLIIVTLFIVFYPVVILWAGAVSDRLWGDPVYLPHPIVGFGRLIAFFEKRCNRGHARRLKGGLVAIGLIGFALPLPLLIYVLTSSIAAPLGWIASVGCVFYMLSGKTLITEVEAVFEAVGTSLEAGRKQVQRIVGRDTSQLSEQEVKLAALETLAENLSDGVVAPVFWFAVGSVVGFLSHVALLMAVGGVCTMWAYKMVNTLDSMIGYRNERYRAFGMVAARIDDVANYLPARLTAVLMLAVARRMDLFPFVRKYGKAHLSPNSGYPEAALAGILNCRFGGPHTYFGEEVVKPFIGDCDRPIDPKDVVVAIRINRLVELVSLLLFTLLWGIIVFYTIIF